MTMRAEGIDTTARPSGTGCKECLETGQWWLHLRRCAECGHIGCCDSSPNRHATRHFHATGHPIIRSFEPGEDWFYDYRTEQFLDGPELAAPLARPADQPVGYPIPLRRFFMLRHKEHYVTAAEQEFAQGMGSLT